MKKKEQESKQYIYIYIYNLRKTHQSLMSALYTICWEL